MIDVTTELKELRLHGMSSAWKDLIDQGTMSTESSRWLIEHLLQAEHTDRAMRSVSHQMNAAKFALYLDFRRTSKSFAARPCNRPCAAKHMLFCLPGLCCLNNFIIT